MKPGDIVLIEAVVTAIGDTITARIHNPQRPSMGVNVRISPDVVRPPEPKTARRKP